MCLAALERRTDPFTARHVSLDVLPQVKSSFSTKVSRGCIVKYGIELAP